MAASSSSCARAHHLLSVLALLAAAFSVTAASSSANGGGSVIVAVGKKSAVLSLRELEWAAAARKIRGRYAQPMQAQILEFTPAIVLSEFLISTYTLVPISSSPGEHKKAESARRAATVLKLKQHLPTTIRSQPAGTERYLTRLLAADEARAASLQLPRAASTQSGSGRGQAVAEVPLTSGIRFQTLNYVTTIALGGESAGAVANFTVIVDTGSDLTWVQCKPCRYCYSQQDPLFDPTGSATYAALPCNASACAASLKDATGAPGTCARSGSGSERCYYALAYGDGSFSRGVLATDTVGLGGASLEGFVFGCGLSNRGLFGGTAGLMGLGRTELSLVSQTSSRFGGVFSYCLPATTSGDSTGSLSLGRGDSSAYRNTTPVAYTRMIADPAQPPFYFMNITGATVGGAAVTASGLGARNVLIDSGTVISRLAPSVYHAIRAEFTLQFGAGTRYPAAPGFSILDTCYNLTGLDEVKVPLLTLQLEGGADVTVDPAGMLFMVRKDGSQVCLAMASLPYEDQMPIIGNYQQKNKRVVYDTVGSRLGFADEDCSYI
ncbi:aspartyl protease family protein At5g10770-like [Lolium rigidum]|uniref:aspartyl protease family protein At5g10770-like n=1 Tax=Lolium rigidum TaxID=89674 RepID=UPI001F5DF538|nr:aspartyl protease family protein At5g10770-like [Lolium rigidum]